jgi:hypothetical protein
MKYRYETDTVGEIFLKSIYVWHIVQILGRRSRASLNRYRYYPRTSVVEPELHENDAAPHWIRNTVKNQPGIFFSVIINLSAFLPLATHLENFSFPVDLLAVALLALQLGIHRLTLSVALLHHTFNNRSVHIPALHGSAYTTTIQMVQDCWRLYSGRCRGVKKRSGS